MKRYRKGDLVKYKVFDVDRKSDYATGEISEVYDESYKIDCPDGYVVYRKFSSVSDPT